MVQLYFENQQAALCAVHTINTLLQGPYMDEIVLSEIALKLDEEERKLLGGTGFTGVNEYNNVRADGMFSSQVIFRALESVGLEPIPITNPAMRHVAQSPETEFAFILNSNEHWYTLRRVGESSHRGVTTVGFTAAIAHVVCPLTNLTSVPLYVPLSDVDSVHGLSHEPTRTPSVCTPLDASRSLMHSTMSTSYALRGSPTHTPTCPLPQTTAPGGISTR